MKKFLAIAIVFAASFAAVSCGDYSEDDFFANESKTTMVSFDYSFMSGGIGNVTRAATSDDEAYTTLYNKILSKELIADSYTITLTEVSSNKSYTFSGNWNDNNSILIKTGTYNVTGKSTASGECLQSKCSIKFNTKIEIKASTSYITLPAEYDCMLLIFDRSVIKNAFVLYGINNSKVSEKNFFNCDNLYYGFSTKLYNENASANQFLIVDYYDDSRQNFSADKFEIGKYYLFSGNSSARSSFSLPKMVKGDVQ